MSNPKYLCVSFSSISMKIEDYIIIGIYFFPWKNYPLNINEI